MINAFNLRQLLSSCLITIFAFSVFISSETKADAGENCPIENFSFHVFATEDESLKASCFKVNFKSDVKKEWEDKILPYCIYLDNDYLFRDDNRTDTILKSSSENLNNNNDINNLPHSSIESLTGFFTKIYKDAGSIKNACPNINWPKIDTISKKLNLNIPKSLKDLESQEKKIIIIQLELLKNGIKSVEKIKEINDEFKRKFHHQYLQNYPKSNQNLKDGNNYKILFYQAFTHYSLSKHSNTHNIEDSAYSETINTIANKIIQHLFDKVNRENKDIDINIDPKIIESISKSKIILNKELKKIIATKIEENKNSSPSLMNKLLVELSSSEIQSLIPSSLILTDKELEELTKKNIENLKKAFNLNERSGEILKDSIELPNEVSISKGDITQIALHIKEIPSVTIFGRYIDELDIVMSLIFGVIIGLLAHLAFRGNISKDNSDKPTEPLDEETHSEPSPRDSQHQNKKEKDTSHFENKQHTELNHLTQSIEELNSKVDNLILDKYPQKENQDNTFNNGAKFDYNVLLEGFDGLLRRIFEENKIENSTSQQKLDIPTNYDEVYRENLSTKPNAKKTKERLFLRLIVRAVKDINTDTHQDLSSAKSQLIASNAYKAYQKYQAQKEQGLHPTEPDYSAKDFEKDFSILCQRPEKDSSPLFKMLSKHYIISQKATKNIWNTEFKSDLDNNLGVRVVIPKINDSYDKNQHIYKTTAQNPQSGSLAIKSVSGIGFWLKSDNGTEQLKYRALVEV